MKIIFILLFLVPTLIAREPVVSGQFYPSNKAELVQIIKYFFDSTKDLPKPQGEIIGLISPHAGYVFSGSVAAYSYKYLAQYKLENPIIILIGESHNFYLRNPAVYSKDGFITPMGNVPLENGFITSLISEGKGLFEDNPQPHIPEHSLEVQLPFLQYIFPKFTIVPILVSRFDYTKSDTIAKTIFSVIKHYKMKRTHLKRKIIVVCSTDMSHYPKYDDAVNIDNQAIELVKSYNPQKYYTELPNLEKSKIKNLSCVFCGETAVGITMILTKLLGGDYVEVLKYANSGDTPRYGDKSRVVGYLASAFIKKGKSSNPTEEKQGMKEKNGEFKITEQNQKLLLDLARKTITEYVTTGKIIDFETQDKDLLTPSAVFVTLTKKGQLRGCIGTTFPQHPLYEAVKHFAISAATEDPRFSPVSKEELDNIKIEISILSPMKRVFSAKDIKEKVHGVVVRREGRSGLFLPQVWEHFEKKEQFLSELCWQKAGLEPNAWQDPKTELYIFTVFSFEEQK